MNAQTATTDQLCESGYTVQDFDGGWVSYDCRQDAAYRFQVHCEMTGDDSLLLCDGHAAEFRVEIATGDALGMSILSEEQV